MTSYVMEITSRNYENFVYREPTIYKVLIFTERKTTAPLFKTLSKKYKDKIIFGEVKSSEKSLVDKFGINKLPALIIVKDAADYKGQLYEGELVMEQISDFLKLYATK